MVLTAGSTDRDGTGPGARGRRGARIPVLMSWSGGKDSAMALNELRRSDHYDLRGLLTTVTRGDDRIGMHGVRRALVKQQAEALGLPLEEIELPPQATNAEYEAAFGTTLARRRAEGCRAVAFGDLFLEDIRAYRDRLVGQHDLAALYPVWGRRGRPFIEDFVAAGFKAVICAVDLKALPAEFAGREVGVELLEALPPGVDPCGENGEFHSFVYDGPDFHAPVAITSGARSLRGGFAFCDLVRASVAFRPPVLPSPPCVRRS